MECRKFSSKTGKSMARKNFLHHYFLFVILCLFAGMIGTKYASSYTEFNDTVQSFIDNGNRRDNRWRIENAFSRIVDNRESPEEVAKELDEQEKNQSAEYYLDGHIQVSRSKGVLAELVNGISSGAFIFTFFSFLLTAFKTTRDTMIVFVLIAFLIWLFSRIFVTDVFKVAYTRLFMEGRIYKRVPIGRLAFLLHIKKWIRASLTMLLKTIYFYLWSLTVVGLPIKYFSYFAVPYILAENPAIPANRVITLSRKMMDGHKWECFKLHLTFIGWEVLSVVTLGITGILYSNPYLEATLCEYYVYLRELAMEKKIEDVELLHDTYLYEASPEEMYDLELYPGAEKRKSHNFAVLNYNRKYSLCSVVMIFMIMSFAGWLWEVSLHLITDGEFVNRGTLHGPWLPIYGTGSILVLLLLSRFREKPALELLAAVVMSGVLEYFSAGLLEWNHHGEKWWNYEGFFINIDGRVCAEGLFVFGLGAMAVVYFIAPLIDNFVRKIPYKKLVVICAVFAIVFAADFIYSLFVPNTGEGITSKAVFSTYEFFS